MVRAGGLWRKPLGQALVSDLNTPVYLFSGFYPELPTPSASLTTRALSWLIPLAILAGFFLIQVQIDQAVTGWLRTTLLSLSIVAEFGMVWIWNQFSI
jgi:hypothetical protein